jgi:hypothetical protein
MKNKIEMTEVQELSRNQNLHIEITNEALCLYFSRVHNNIHKLLYLKEENNPNLTNNINDLILELVSADELCWNNPYFVQLIFNIQSLKYKLDNFKQFRSHIFKCENICDGISDNLSKSLSKSLSKNLSKSLSTKTGGD